MRDTPETVVCDRCGDTVDEWIAWPGETLCLPCWDNDDRPDNQEALL